MSANTEFSVKACMNNNVQKNQQLMIKSLY